MDVWTWIRSNLGCVLGSIMVVVAVTWVIVDWTSGDHGNHIPPAWYGGPQFVPERQEVCPGVPMAKVRAHSESWTEACWAPYPEPVRIDAELCDGSAAPPGTLRWHTCDELRKEGPQGLFTPSCVDAEDQQQLKNGRAYPRIVAGVIESGDVYIRVDNPHLSDCTYAHEGGHARGITNGDGTDSHTTLDHSLMYGKGCPEPYTMTWLDRCEGGDWPYP